MLLHTSCIKCFKLIQICKCIKLLFVLAMKYYVFPVLRALQKYGYALLCIYIHSTACSSNNNSTHTVHKKTQKKTSWEWLIVKSRQINFKIFWITATLCLYTTSTFLVHLYIAFHSKQYFGCKQNQFGARVRQMCPKQ